MAIESPQRQIEVQQIIAVDAGVIDVLRVGRTAG